MSNWSVHIAIKNYEILKFLLLKKNKIFQQDTIKTTLKQWELQAYQCHLIFKT